MSDDLHEWTDGYGVAHQSPVLARFRHEGESYVVVNHFGAPRIEAVSTQHDEDMAFINEHRVACGYTRFETLSPAEVKRYLDLILKHAPYGEDPFMEFSDV